MNRSAQGLALALISALALVSCPDQNGGSLVKPPTLGEMISSIPRIEEMLPKSLRAGNSSEAPSSSRALGDVIAIDPSNLPGVTANGYYSLTNAISKSSVNVFLDILEDALSSYVIEEDVPTAIPSISIPAGTGMSAPDGGGVLLVTRPREDLYEIRWNLPLTYYDQVSSSSISLDGYMKAAIEGDDTATMKVALHFQGHIEGVQDPMLLYNFYDAATKRLLTYFKAGADENVQSLNVSDGKTRYFAMNPLYGMHVAYADDDSGGIVYAHSESELDEIFVEFYNGDGDLVMTQWGNNTDESYKWSLGDFSNPIAVNIRDALFDGAPIGGKPESVKLKRVYDTGAESLTVYASIDGGISWSEELRSEALVPGSDWPWAIPLWMQAEAVSSGDSLYYYLNGSFNVENFDDDHQVVECVDSFQVGFTVPDLVDYLGKQYYLQDRYMLKFLSLAPSLVSDGFSILMKEGDFFYGWKSDGIWLSSTTKPEGWDSLPVDDRSTWINKEYWLEKAGIEGNDPMALNRDKGDLALGSLREDSFFFWVDGSGTQTKAHVLSTTGASLVGFELDAGASSVIDGVKPGITSYYEEMKDKSFADFEAEISALVPDMNVAIDFAFVGARKK